jgi:putative endonuclease
VSGDRHIWRAIRAPAGPSVDYVTQDRLTIGRRAEAFAAGLLARDAWEIVERNARTRYGELDIVALDDAALVFVEVKAGRQGAVHGPERPVLSIGPKKRRRVRRLATAWMAERRRTPRYAQIRFDAIGVTFDRRGRVVDFEHIKGAF